MAEIKLSEHFTIQKLLKFTVPTMLMMLLYTTYVLVDGIFVSNFVGDDAYAAVNLVGNYLLVFSVMGTMLGSGGAALISKTLGEGDHKKASSQYSFIIWFSIFSGIVFSLVAFFTVNPVMLLIGADDKLLGLCDQYGRIVACSLLFYILQMEGPYFFSMIGRETQGFVIAMVSVVTNILLDALFIVGFGWGIKGAASASLIGITIGGILPIAYFFINKGLPVQLSGPVVEHGILVPACINGSSEMVVNLSISLVGMLFNFQLLRYEGDDGVAAYGVIQAVTIVFTAIFEGYSIGIIPVVGYHFGSKNNDELKSLLRKSLVILSAINAFLFLVSELFAKTFAIIFVSYNPNLMEMTIHGLKIYAFMYLFSSFNVFCSSFFTGLNDGLNSAIISFARTVVLLVACLLILPVILDLDGIWLATPVAELLSLVVSGIIILKNNNKYQYI